MANECLIKALVMARLEEYDLPGIFKSTSGILFLGTPHRGTGKITSQSMMYSIIAQDPQCPIEPAVLESLKSESDVLIDVRNDFMKLCTREEVAISIVCFFEQKSTNVGSIIGAENMNVGGSIAERCM